MPKGSLPVISWSSLSASHLRSILKSWNSHYNTGRPHMGLGPGVPDPPPTTLARLRPRLFYVFVVIEHGSRRLVHCNVTAHPTSDWTMQQLREAVGLESQCEYLLHDRDSIFAEHLDESIARLGIKVLKSPPRCPMANAICERVVGTIRRECLDWLIPPFAPSARRIVHRRCPSDPGRPPSRVLSRSSRGLIEHLRTTGIARKPQLAVAAPPVPLNRIPQISIDIALAARGFVLGRFPYAGPRPHLPLKRLASENLHHVSHMSAPVGFPKADKHPGPVRPPWARAAHKEREELSPFCAGHRASC